MHLMSNSKRSLVFQFEGGDPDMLRAYENARQTFRYFWREVAWERRRIIPALGLACVKAPFWDEPAETDVTGNPKVEHMWFSEIDFDGQTVSGTLLNAPNDLTSISEGDFVSIPLEDISDWMYVIDGEVFGAHTVNLMRARMGYQERQSHDGAWGLNFGDPNKIRLIPEPKKQGGLLQSWFGKAAAPDLAAEHPMSINMAASLKEQLAKDPSLISSTDENGWTLLHQEALAGSAPTVKVLLDAGANRNAKTNLGVTPLQLAQSLRWDAVAALLSAR